MDTNTQSSSPLAPSPATDAPAGGRRPDPGSRPAAIIALVASCVLFLFVVVSQQMSVQKAAEAKPDPAVASDTSMFALYAKGFAKGFGAAFSTVADKDRATTLAPVIEQIDDMAHTPDEKLRAAIVAAELVGAEKALKLLEASNAWVEKEISDNKADPAKGMQIDDKVRADFSDNRALLVKHYQSKVSEEKGDGSPPVGLSAAEMQVVRAHFGWFGRLADVYGVKDAPDRKALFAGGEWLIVLLLVIGTVMAGALLAGAVLFIVAIVMIARGTIKTRFVPPLPGGSVYLETLAVFIAGFFALKIILLVLAKLLFPKGTTEFPAWFDAIHLGLQWMLALIPLYPLLRGVSFTRWRSDIGLVAPNGVLREIFFGILAYLAGIPIFIIGVVISLTLKFIAEAIKTRMGGEPGIPASNPIFDEIIGSDPIALILLVSLATIWAPFVEEAIFRGALFRHLRSRTGLLIAAIISALAFGGMHGYEFVLLGPVISLGFVFALMREWRGSIIPSITAHMLHNGSVMAMAIIMIRLIAA